METSIFIKTSLGDEQPKLESDSHYHDMVTLSCQELTLIIWFHLELLGFTPLE